MTGKQISKGSASLPNNRTLLFDRRAHLRAGPAVCGEHGETDDGEHV